MDCTSSRHQHMIKLTRQTGQRTLVINYFKKQDAIKHILRLVLQDGQKVMNSLHLRSPFVLNVVHVAQFLVTIVMF